MQPDPFLHASLCESNYKSCVSAAWRLHRAIGWVLQFSNRSVCTSCTKLPAVMPCLMLQVLILNVNDHLAFSLQCESLAAPDPRTDYVPSVHHVTFGGSLTFQCLPCDSWGSERVRWFFSWCCSAITMVITGGLRVTCHAETERPVAWANRGTAALLWWRKMLCNQWRQTCRKRNRQHREVGAECTNLKYKHMTVRHVWSFRIWAL